jgi:hypothetical protein
MDYVELLLLCVRNGWMQTEGTGLATPTCLSQNRSN